MRSSTLAGAKALKVSRRVEAVEHAECSRPIWFGAYHDDAVTAVGFDGHLVAGLESGAL
jgi:hypothetical protein